MATATVVTATVVTATRSPPRPGGVSGQLTGEAKPSRKQERNLRPAPIDKEASVSPWPDPQREDRGAHAQGCHIGRLPAHLLRRFQSSPCLESSLRCLHQTRPCSTRQPTTRQPTTRQLTTRQPTTRLTTHASIGLVVSKGAKWSGLTRGMKQCAYANNNNSYYSCRRVCSNRLTARAQAGCATRRSGGRCDRGGRR